MVIHIITDGYVLPYLLDPNFEKHLPVIPAEVKISSNFRFYNKERILEAGIFEMNKIFVI